MKRSVCCKCFQSKRVLAFFTATIRRGYWRLVWKRWNKQGEPERWIWDCMTALRLLPPRVEAFSDCGMRISDCGLKGTRLFISSYTKRKQFFAALRLGVKNLIHSRKAAKALRG